MVASPHQSHDRQDQYNASTYAAGQHSQQPRQQLSINVSQANGVHSGNGQRYGDSHYDQQQYHHDEDEQIEDATLQTEDAYDEMDDDASSEGIPDEDIDFSLTYAL